MEDSSQKDPRIEQGMFIPQKCAMAAIIIWGIVVIGFLVFPLFDTTPKYSTGTVSHDINLAEDPKNFFFFSFDSPADKYDMDLYLSTKGDIWWMSMDAFNYWYFNGQHEYDISGTKLAYFTEVTFVYEGINVMVLLFLHCQGHIDVLQYYCRENCG
jgi:hypothetical protein